MLAADRLDPDRASLLLDDSACDLDWDSMTVACDQFVLVGGRFDLMTELALTGLFELFVPFGWHEFADRPAGCSLDR